MKDTQKLTFSIAKFSEDTAVAVAEASRRMRCPASLPPRARALADSSAAS